MLAIVRASGRSGISGMLLRARLHQREVRLGLIDQARHRLEREGLVVFDASRWRIARPGDVPPVPPGILALVMGRTWPSLADVVLAGLRAAHPDSMSCKGLGLLAEASGYRPEGASACLAALARKGLAERAEARGRWRAGPRAVGWAPRPDPT